MIPTSSIGRKWHKVTIITILTQIPKLCSVRKLVFQSYVCLNPFPHDRILDQTKVKAFAEDNLNVTKMIISVFDRVENIVGK